MLKRGEEDSACIMEWVEKSARSNMQQKGTNKSESLLEGSEIRCVV